jgi:hypothetical protein
MSEPWKEVFEFSLEDAKFEEYKSKIAALKSENRPEVFRKPSRNSGILEKDARQALKMADEAYACSEWLEAGRVYITLSEAKVGPVSMISRLAICHFFFGDNASSFECGKQAIEACPVESASYLALALVKLRMKQFSESARWLDLAELALRPNLKVIAQARDEIEICAMLHQQELQSFRHLMKTRPNWLELFIDKDDHADLDDLPAVIESFKRIKENPECLEAEMRKVPDVQVLVWSNWANSEDVFPRRYSDEIDREHAQSGCAFHSINSKIMMNIAKHIELEDLSSVQRSCKFFNHLAHHPEISKEMYCRSSYSPLPKTWWGQECKPWYWVGALRCKQVATDFLELMGALSIMLDPTSKSYYAKRAQMLRVFYLKHHLYVTAKDASSPKFAWITLADSIIQAPTRDNAIQLTTQIGPEKEGRALLASLEGQEFWLALLYCLSDTTVSEYMEQVPSMVSVYIGAMLLGKNPNWVDFSSLFFALLASLLHADASAALAVHFGIGRLAEMDFQLVCDTKETIQRMPANMFASRFDMNGIWQGVMHYSSPALDTTYSEEMIMKLKFPNPHDHAVDQGGPLPFELIGMGVDSIGEFELEDALVDQLRFTVSFTKVYNRSASEGGTLKHAYDGIIYSCGMGGHFGAVPDELGVRQFGYWFMGRPRAYSGGSLAVGDTLDESKIGSWDELVAGIKAKAASNARLRAKLIADANIPEAYFAEYPHAEIYELPVMSEADEALLELRQALRRRALARTESTSLAQLRENVQELQEWIGRSQTPYELDYIPFESDNEEKATLRVHLMDAYSALETRWANMVLFHNVHRLPEFVATLTRHECDLSQPEVQEIMRTVSRWSTSVLIMAPGSATHWLEVFDRVLKFDPNAEQQQGDWEEDESDPTQARVPSSISRFMKQNANVDDSDEESDSDEDAWISKRGKRRQRGGLSTTSIVLLGTIASAAVVAGAFMLGRFLAKRRPD